MPGGKCCGVPAALVAGSRNHQPGNAGRPGTLQNFLAVVSKAVMGQIGANVDQVDVHARFLATIFAWEVSKEYLISRGE